jgi:hypothetical protein
VTLIAADRNCSFSEKKDDALLSAGALSYFAVDSRNKTGQNEFAVKPSQDGEDLIFEK